MPTFRRNLLTEQNTLTTTLSTLTAQNTLTTTLSALSLATFRRRLALCFYPDNRKNGDEVCGRLGSTAKRTLSVEVLDFLG